MKFKLTEKSIKALAAKDKAYEVVDEGMSCLTLRVQPTGHMSFYIRYRNKAGVSRRAKLGVFGQITLTQARELAKQHLGKIASGCDPQLEKQAVKVKAQRARHDSTTLKQFINKDFKPWVLRNRKSGAYTIFVLEKTFSMWMDLPMRDLTRRQVEAWQLSELERGLVPVTVNRTLSALRSVYTRALALGVLETNPLSAVPALTAPKETRVRFLDENEAIRLLMALDKRNQKFIQERVSANAWRAERGYELLPEILPHQFADHLPPIVILTMNTGMRRGEVLQLKWADIDFARRLLTIRAANAKSNKARYIPLNEKAMTALKTWKETCPNKEGLLFPSKHQEIMKDIKTAWGRLLKQAGIKDFRYHDLRHHFASMLTMKGADLNTVRELLGHADFSTTLRYAHLADSHKAEAVALLV